MARIVVDVMLRKEIHDPQGEAITSAAHRLGFSQVLGVRQGKRFEVELSGPMDEATLARVAGMVRGSGEAIFAVARTAGWIAHALEEYAKNVPLRPRTVYTGPSAN